MQLISEVMRAMLTIEVVEVNINAISSPMKSAGNGFVDRVAHHVAERDTTVQVQNVAIVDPVSRDAKNVIECVLI